MWKWWRKFEGLLAGKATAVQPAPAPEPVWQPEPILCAGLLNDAKHLLDRDIIDLFFHAGFYKVEPEEVLQELLLRAAAGRPAAVFVGWRDGEPQALAIMIPPSTLSPWLLGYHFYCSGGAGLRDMLLEEIVAWSQREGYDSCVAFAVRGGPAWEKVFHAALPSKWGDVYEFDLKGAADGFIQRRRG